MPPRRTEMPTDADSAPEAEPMADPTPDEPTPGRAKADPVARPRAKRRPAGETRPRAAGTALAEPPEATASSSVRPAAAEPEESDADTDLQPAAEASTGLNTPIETESANGTEPKTAGAESTAAPVPAAGTGATADVEADPDPDAEADRKRMRVLVGVAVLAVLLVCASVVLAVGAITARTSGPLANKAFLDTGQTAELVGQMTSADRKSTRLNSSHAITSRMPSSA